MGHLPDLSASGGRPASVWGHFPHAQEGAQYLPVFLLGHIQDRLSGLDSILGHFHEWQEEVYEAIQRLGAEGLV